MFLLHELVVSKRIQGVEACKKNSIVGVGVCGLYHNSPFSIKLAACGIPSIRNPKDVMMSLIFSLFIKNLSISVDQTNKLYVCFLGVTNILIGRKFMRECRI